MTRAILKPWPRIEKAWSHNKSVRTNWASPKAFLEWSLANGFRPGYWLVKSSREGQHSPSNSMWVPPGYAPRQARAAATVVTAFGETKSALAWSQDPRCDATLPSLLDRLKRLPPEEAMTYSADGRENYVLHNLWKNMRRRQAKGRVRVSREWDRFTPFLRWAEETGWRPGLKLVRIDRCFGFGPDNCRWAVRQEYSTHRGYAAFGETKGMAEWMADPRCRLSQPCSVYARLAAGFSFEKAITTPPEPGAALSER